LKLLSLEMNNFQPYKGQQGISFPTDSARKVMLVFGDNMRGKTSLLNAIRWALYGKTLDRLSREIPLFDLVNSEAREAGDFTLSVKLRFEVGDAEYELYRSAEPDDLIARPRANHQFRQQSMLRRNGVVQKGEDIENFVNTFIPEDISRFYLFDGELLDEYESLLREESSQGELIKEAIEKILGVPALIHGRQETRTQMKRSQSLQAKENKHVVENQDWANQSLKLQAELDVLVRDKEEQQAKLGTISQEVDEAAIELEEMAPIEAINRDLKSLIQQKEQMTVASADRQRQKHEILRGAWKDLLQPRLEAQRTTLQEQIEAHRNTLLNEGGLRGRFKHIEEVLLRDVCPTCEQPINSGTKIKLGAELGQLEADIETINARNVGVVTASHDLTILSKIQGTGAAKSLLNLEKAEKKDALEITKIETQIDACEEKLRGHNLVRVAQLQRKKEGLVRLQGKMQSDIERTSRDIAEKEAKRNQLSKLMSRNPQGRKLRSAKEVDIYTELQDIFEEGVDVLRDRLRLRVEAEASEVFRTLTTEKTYTGLRINAAYGLTILDRNGDQVALRSAGAEQIVAMSLLGALNRSANRPGPIVVDTPFGRLDPKHRLNILSYIPNMGEQIVFLVHEGEINKETGLEPIANHVGATYQITRINSSHSVIERA
jgi:DNA sulfur modification protein DndD